MAEILTLDLSRVANTSDFDLVYQDEDSDVLTDEIDPLSDEYSPDDSLPPLRRILTYYKAENNDNRQFCVRLIPDALQSISTMTEFNMLLQVSFILARDHFHVIRIGVLSNIPGFLEKNNQLALGGEDMAAENRQQLLDVLIRLLTDADLEVRRVGQNVIGVCMSSEENTQRKEELLERLFPIIKRSLGRDENYDLRMDAAMLISRLASQVGQANILKYFIPVLPAWANDTMFHVRKAFAVCCRELSSVLDEELVETHILPLYLPLCKDEVWGVRKACADVFSDVALSCNLGTRYDRLTPVFLKLLHDDSRWVRKAAYQSLGAFIATFYIPSGNTTTTESETQAQDESSVGLLSESLLLDNSLLDTSSPATTSDPDSENRHPSPNTTPPVDDGAISNSSTPIHSGSTSRVMASAAAEGLGGSGGQQDSEFNSFEFWRSPIPSVDVEGKEGSAKDRTKVEQDGGGESEVKARLSFEGSANEDRTSGSENACTSGSCGETTPISKGNSVSCFNGKGEGGVVPDDETEKESLDLCLDDLHLEDVERSGSEKAGEVASSEGVLNFTGAGNPNGVTSALSAEQTHQPPAETRALLRVRSAPSNTAVRRVSMDQGLISGHKGSDRILQEKKRRRWSLNMPNHINNLPQVRVFVHSATGQVTEQLSPSSPISPTDASSEKKEAPPTPSATQGAEPVNATVNTSEAMELTCEPTVKYEEESYVEQEIVPDELMEVYLSMTEHSRVQTVDTDLLYYCAYSLPGVTLTLGKNHWELLKPTFDYLAEDLQWKIRRVLAFSLHELARVLGCDITCRDILPIFEEYCTKDVDDVKIGTLTHLAEFFELLPVDSRVNCLPKVLNGLLQMENQKNWRYRNTLVEQLLLLSDLFNSSFLHQHIYPLALELSGDKVAEVRSSAGFLIGKLLQKISEGGTVQCHTLLQKLRVSLVTHPCWLQRLMYVKHCETFLLNGHISQEVFSQECLPSILQLARDKVPNVRIAIAKLLKNSVMQCEYFQSESLKGSSTEELYVTLECLQHDADRDVKFFAGGELAETRRRARQWYTQRARSESYASSDIEQYQDAPDSMLMEMGSIARSSASSEIVSSSSASTTEYVEIGSDRASSEYLELASSAESLDLNADCYFEGHTNYLEPGHAQVSTLTMESFMNSPGEEIMVANNVEVSCEEGGEFAGDSSAEPGMANPSNAPERNLGSLQQDTKCHGDGDEG